MSIKLQQDHRVRTKPEASARAAPPLTIRIKGNQLQQRSGAIHLCNVQDVPHLRKVGGDVLAPAEAEGGR